MIRTTLGARACGLALAATLAIAGCQSAPATNAPSAAASTAPSASPAATTAAAPSPSAAADVAPLFVAAMKALSSGTVQVDGTATVGNVKLTIAVSTAFDGPDSQGQTTTTVAGNSTTVGTVQVAGKYYQKVGDGPWLAATAPKGAGLTTSLKDASASSFTDNGVKTHGGVQVHELTAGSGSAFDPSVFLGSATGVSNVAGTTTFYCLDDGTPTGATIALTWKQAAGTQTADAAMSFEITFAGLGTPQTIPVPDQVWQVFTSDRYSYSVAYPPDYNYTKDKVYDYFIAPGTTFFSTSRAKNGGYTLNVLAKSETASIKSTFKAKTVANTAITISGLPGRMLSATGTNVNFGGKVVIYEAIVLKGPYAYYIVWASKPGNETADLATFKQAVSTFRIA